MWTIRGSIMRWAVATTIGAIAILSMVRVAHAQCPASPGAVSATLSAQVTFDAVANVYRYVYGLTNDSSSAADVNRVVVRIPAGSVENLQAPVGWRAVLGRVGSAVAIHWTAVQLAVPSQSI